MMIRQLAKCRSSNNSSRLLQCSLITSSRPNSSANTIVGVSPPLNNNNRYFSYSLLPKPTILYRDNHLLVVDKPSGWHSVPNNPGRKPSPKCLLTYLKQQQLGGGSKSDFLLPLHRIDQPCSGVLLLGKTSKAASRITKLWKQKLVAKEYLAVVSSTKMDLLRKKSEKLDDDDPKTGNDDQEEGWYTLKGVIIPSKDKESRNEGHRSVKIYSERKSLSKKAREVTVRNVAIHWKSIKNDDVRANDDDKIHLEDEYTLLHIQTKDGTRHMIRAMLSQIGQCPIVGDLRYNRTATVLADQSVALHAYRLHLNSNGNSNKKQFTLGSLSQLNFEAPVPSKWKSFFGITNGP